MKNKFKVYTAITIIILVAIVLVTVFTFAYFNADTSNNQNILLNAHINDYFSTSLTANVTNTLSISVPIENMYEENAGTIAGTDSENIIVTINGGSASNPISCDFSFVWITDSNSDAYVPTNDDVLEYSLKIVNTTTNTDVIPETNMKTILANNQIANVNITTTSTVLTYVYTATTTLYNLNIPQNIYDKRYSGRISIKNVSCEVS